MEEIINYKAKKKKLIFKTGILDNFLTHDTYFEESPLRIKILANGFFFASYNYNCCIYDNNFTEVFSFSHEFFQLDKYTFYEKPNKIIRFNKQFNNYSILYDINENVDLDFIFKLDNNIYIFRRNKDLVLLEEGENNIFYKYELSNVFENKQKRNSNYLFFLIFGHAINESENIIYFTFNKKKFGLYISHTFIIFEFKDKAINILNKKNINLKTDILKVITAKENIIIFLSEKYDENGYSIYTFNIETMQIISIFNIADEAKNEIYLSLDDINAFKFMRIIDEDLYNKYHRCIKKKK